MTTYEDLNLLRRSLGSASPEGPGRLVPLCGLLLGGIVSLGGVLALQGSMAPETLRAPGSPPVRLAHAGYAPLPGLRLLPDAGLVSLPETLLGLSRQPSPGEPALTGPRAKLAERLAADLEPVLTRILGDGPWLPGRATGKVRITLPRWANLTFLSRRLGSVLAPRKGGGFPDPGRPENPRLSTHREDDGSGYLRITCGSEARPWLDWTFDKPVAKGRVALIVDDVGYGGPSTRKLLETPIPMGIAILPFYPGSTQAHDRAIERGLDPMLHMPMQPKAAEGKYRENHVVGAHLPPEEIRRRTRAALDSLPGILGFNNHMGSLATESWFVCSEVLGVAKDRPLFFVDSLTSPRSVAQETARKLGIPTTRRNTAFLDNDPSRAGVDAAFAELLSATGSGRDQVAILHDKPESVASMDHARTRFRDRGIELAFVSELVR